MSNSSFKKIICWLLVCLMVQPTFGQEASIMLYYKPGINNVSFKYNGTHDSLNPISINTEEYTDSTIVKVAENNMGAGKKSDLSSYASDYINNLQLFNHMVGLDTKAVTPSQLNFWVNGNLSINGKEVAPFSLGMLSGYWWYGSHNGNRYVGNNDITDKGLDITDVSGTKYCLKEPSSNSDELFVYSGNCSEAGGDYAADVGKDKQQSFSFVYGPDIKSISFDVTNNQSEDGSGHKLSNNAIQTDNQGSLTKVTVTAGEIGSLGTANTFNRILGYIHPNLDMSHILQLTSANDPAAHKPAAAIAQNLWLTGKLKINGQRVKGIVVLGHNSESNTNWWIGSTNGTRYDSPSNSGLNVVGADDGEAYCINGSQTNYQTVVTSGACNDYSPISGGSVSRLLTFEYGQHITSVTFEPTSSESANSTTYISEDGTGNPLSYGIFAYAKSQWFQYNTRLSFMAGNNGSYGTAYDFNNLINNDPMHALEVMDRSKDSAHKLSLPQNMNFWIKGTLKVESYVVSQNFIIGHSGASDQNWWIASPDGTRFDSNTNSGMNVQYVDNHGVAHRYCLSQYKNNSELIVAEGVCTTESPKLHAMKNWLKVTGAVIVVTLVVYKIGCMILTDGEAPPLLCSAKKMFKAGKNLVGLEEEIAVLEAGGEEGGGTELDVVSKKPVEDDHISTPKVEEEDSSFSIREVEGPKEYNYDEKSQFFKPKDMVGGNPAVAEGSSDTGEEILRKRGSGQGFDHRKHAVGYPMEEEGAGIEELPSSRWASGSGSIPPELPLPIEEGSVSAKGDSEVLNNSAKAEPKVQPKAEANPPVEFKQELLIGGEDDYDKWAGIYGFDSSTLPEEEIAQLERQYVDLLNSIEKDEDVEKIGAKNPSEGALEWDIYPNENFW